jgi:outer membrane protein OmpA-like peptidoglycan-associated protein
VTRPRQPRRQALAATLALLFLAGASSGCASLGLNKPPAETLVVVVPSRADGHIGTVVVNEGDKREVIHEAYGAVRTREHSEAMVRSTMSADEVNAVFADASAALPHQVVTYTLYFVVAKPELTPESNAALDAMLGEVASRQAAEIVITGHTDRMGTDARNDALSLKRAQWVRDLVIRRGVAGNIVSAVGVGEREPIVPTADGVAEPKNRRVEILVR